MPNGLELEWSCFHQALAAPEFGPVKLSCTLATNATAAASAVAGITQLHIDLRLVDTKNHVSTSTGPSDDHAGATL